MNYKEFKEAVVEEVKKIIPEDKFIDLKKVHKNNFTLDCLSIYDKEGGPSPAIYLNYYYEDYKNGRSIENTVGDIMDFYEYFKDANAFDITVLDDYENVKNSVICRLINAEMNKDILDESPHVRVLDLAIVFFCSFQIDGQWGGVRITNEIMDGWKISLDRLKEDAMENTLRILGIEVHNTGIKVERFLYGMEPPKERPDKFDLKSFKESVTAQNAISTEKDGLPGIVISNYRCFMGATCMIYDDVLEVCAEVFGGSFFVIPSSVHELMLVPVRDDIRKSYLDDLVKHVNSGLNKGDILSDHAYIYMKGERQLVM